MNAAAERHRHKLLRRMRLEWAPSVVCAHHRERAHASDIFHVRPAPEDHEEYDIVSVKTHYNWAYKLNVTTPRG